MLAVALTALAVLQPCGDAATIGAGSYNVHAKAVNCRHARWVARRYSDRTLHGQQRRIMRIGRFRCRTSGPRGELVHVTCLRAGGRQAIRFDWGS